MLDYSVSVMYSNIGSKTGNNQITGLFQLFVRELHILNSVYTVFLMRNII